MAWQLFSLIISRPYRVSNIYSPVRSKNLVSFHMHWYWIGTRYLLNHSPAVKIDIEKEKSRDCVLCFVEPFAQYRLNLKKWFQMVLKCDKNALNCCVIIGFSPSEDNSNFSNIILPGSRIQNMMHE